MPSMSGSLGADSPPVALISVVLVSSPADVRTRQIWASSSHAAAEQLDPEVEAVEHSRAGGDLLEVGQDLGLRRVGVRPVGVGREREAVEVARDVARGAGVGVGPPRPAEPVGLLDDQELLAVVLQPDGQRDAGEPGADDEVVDVRRERHGPDATSRQVDGDRGVAGGGLEAHLPAVRRR